MKTLRYSIRIAILAAVLAAALCPTGALLRAVADEGIGFGNAATSPYGTFSGIQYVKHEGRFVGTASGDYSVPFEVVTPADPTLRNGIVLMETLHSWGPGGRDAYLTPEFLFARGFSHAAIGWHPDDVDPFAGYSTEEAVEILHNFALALREDPEAQALVGEVRRVYGLCVAKPCEPLYTLLRSPGKGLLDFTFLMASAWREEVFTLAADTNPVMVLLSEADLVPYNFDLGSVHTKALRGSSPTYRSYEVAGGPHISDVPWIREIAGPMGASSEGTTPLDWSPVARALFLAGHRWVTEGADPPPSTSISDGPAGQIDPVYEAMAGLKLETGIARDGNGNALGGIRLPDLHLGRGQFIAADHASFYDYGLYGAFKDLQCEPLADGSPRFPSHEAYVSRFRQQAEGLVADGFLLPEDSQRMIVQAEKSDVGKPEGCIPGALPVTGEPRDGEGTWQLLALVGFVLAGVAIGLRPRTKAT